MAVPLVRVAVPRLVLPAAKKTEPVGLNPLTVAVNATFPFTLAALGEACNAVALRACATVILIGAEELDALLLSPG